MVDILAIAKKESITVPKIPSKKLPLNPPPAPKKSQISIENTDKSIPGINYNELANSSDFQRLVIKIAKMILPESFKSVSTRKSNEVMKRDFNKKVVQVKKNLNIVSGMNPNLLKDLKEFQSQGKLKSIDKNWRSEISREELKKLAKKSSSTKFLSKEK